LFQIQNVSLKARVSKDISSCNKFVLFLDKKITYKILGVSFRNPVFVEFNKNFVSVAISIIKVYTGFRWYFLQSKGT
jgi:hypothetical protein